MPTPSRLLALLFGCSLLGALSCKPAPTPGPAGETLTEAPAELVSAYTSGVVGRRATVQVRFVRDVVLPDQVGQELTSSPFRFEPAIEGRAVWTSAAELTFTPAAELKPGQTYQGAVALSQLLPAIPEARDFELRLDVIQQRLDAELIGLAAADGDAALQTMSGRITLADEADGPLVEKTLRAEHGKDELSVEWTHHPGGKDHTFLVRGVRRVEDGSKLSLAFDGDPIDAEQSFEREVEVPGLNQFVVSSVRPVMTGDRHIEIRFSDPLFDGQDLRGRITVEGRHDIQLQRDGSIVRVYSASPWSDAETVHIEGVRNSAKFALKTAQDFTVSFAPMVPAVRFVSNGVILPSNTNQTLPIEVTNVRAITVEATRVYERNVPQFLQVNALNGADQLLRVGKVVWKERVEIDGAESAYNRVQHLGLDVSKLVKGNTTGLYRIAVRFERADILVDCPTPAWTPDEQSAADWDDPQTERSFWDYWDSLGSEEEPWTAYERRFDPCARSFYAKLDDHDITATHNVLLTDLGLVAKQGVDGQLVAVVTDLVSATPMAEAEVEVLDYQLQRIGGGRTGADGVARLDISAGKPFALVGRKNGQTSWLRLDKGSSLAVSHFDVGGAAVNKGLKGYLYGERGIWRPGDDIYLSFMLHDAAGRVPAQHPAEFELENPRGQIVERRTVTDPVDGFYRLNTRTAADAPTGNYTARVRVGGAVFEKVLRVETVVPNRLKIGLAVADMVRAAELRLSSTLESRWLHGALAPNFAADIELSLSPRTTQFSRFTDFTFDDPLASFAYEPAKIWEDNLDSQGKAMVEAEIPAPEGAPGLLTGRLRTRVFEPSGAFSVDEANVVVSPHARYVGVQLPKGDAARGMLLTDTKHAAKLVLLDEDGKPVPSGTLECALYKIDWRWWWEKGPDDLSRYADAENLRAIQTGTATVKNGVATWDFEVKYPDWGRYLVVAKDKDGTHRTGKIVYIDWPGWAGRASADNPGGASVLSLSADQQKVSVGQPVTLSFPMPKGGRALVSLESGSRVISTAWVEPTEGADTARYTFNALPDMAPGVYANVTVIQPNTARGNDAPIRLYGITPIEVFDPATKLAPKISAPAKFEPESTALVSVSETSGRPMTYTLAIVDEGLLGLTRFQTPDAWSSFYQREALGVRSWDLYDQVVGAYGGALEGLLSIGGDGAGLDGPQPQAQRFKPMVHYAGPFTLAAGETKQHKVEIPQYIGEVRVMVVAGHDGAYGAAEQSVSVKKPLMVLASLPRVLGPRETVALPVSVFALDDRIKDVTLEVRAEGPVTLNGERKRTLKFSGVGDKMSTFELAVGDAVGIAKLHVTATGGGQTAKQDIEIQVRHPGASTSAVVSSAVEPGKSWTVDVALPGLPGTNSAVLELSRVPPLDLGRRLDDLVRYPHGCVEQTTSAAFPQVYLSQLMDLTPARAAEVEGHVRYAISKLRTFQGSDGGFGYWPGERAQDWSTTYVGHFLLEAERAGYLLPAGMKTAWVKAQKERSNRWVKDRANADLEQAYRLYTLALAGQPDLGAMNRLSEVSLGNTARWRLAAAYLLAGQRASADAVLAKATLEVPQYSELTGTFGSDERDEALILEALVLRGDLERASRLAAKVSAHLTSGDVSNTQTIATSLVALARFATRGGTADRVEASWSLAGGAAQTVGTDKPIVQIPLAIAQTGQPRVVVQNRGGKALYARIITRGTPPLGQEQEANQGLSLTVSYRRPEGGEVDVATVEHGADLVAHVTVANTSGYRLDELALSHILPSGWQVGAVSPGASEGFQYRDVRDDRVYTYFDLEPDQTLELDVPVNASYAGRYYLPPVHVETMYDPTLFATEPGRWIDVAALPEG